MSNKFSKYTLNTSVALMFVSAILYLFNIGPTSQPLFTYIKSQEIINTISYSVLTLSVVIISLMIYFIVFKKYRNLPIILLGLISVILPLDIVLGGNIFSITLSTVSLVCLLSLIIVNKINKNKKRA